jgi:hypothetical protein
VVFSNRSDSSRLAESNGNNKSQGLDNASGACGKLMVTGTLVAQPVNNSRLIRNKLRIISSP